MDIKNIRVAWSSRDAKTSSTTDQDGYHERIFSFTSGDNEKALVRNDNNEASCYQREPFKSPGVLIEVQVWHTKDKQKVFIVATINRHQEQVLVP